MRPQHLLLALLLALLAASPLWAAAQRDIVFRLSCPGVDGATMYARFHGTSMSIAHDADATLLVTPVSASGKTDDPRGADGYYRSWSFPPTKLPVSLPGVSEITGSFRAVESHCQRGDGEPVQDCVQVTGLVQLHRLAQDPKGGDWRYATTVSAMDRGGQGASEERPLVALLPDLSKGEFSLRAEAKIEQHNARLGVRALCNQTTFSEIQRNGKPAAVTLEVVDSKGRLVKKEKGDLAKFGFT